MSCMKKSKIGLLVGLAVVVLSLCSLALLQLSAADPDLENNYYTVNVSVLPDSGSDAVGTVLVEGSFQNEQGQFRYGSSVTLTATPGRGYRFVRWEGDFRSASNPVSFTVQKEDELTYNITAVFEAVQYDIVYDDDPRLQFDSDAIVPEKHTYGTQTRLPTPKNTLGYTFVGWIANSTGIVDKEYDGGSYLGAEEYTDTIYLTPVYEPNNYNVTCIDKIGSADGTILGEILIEAPFDSPYSGADAPAPEVPYRGYFFLKEHCGYTELSEVTANTSLNVVERYYQAKTYRIIYNYGEGVHVVHNGAPTQHVYGTETVIDTPIREGYDFVGWKIGNADADPANTLPPEFIYEGNSFRIAGDAYDHPDWTYENRDSEEVAIVLTAVWSPISYDVQYEGIDGIDAGISLPGERVYNEAFRLPNLTKQGYTFLGWTLEGFNEEPEKDFELPASYSAENDLVFVAHWSANGYEVTLDPDADDAVPGDTTVTVEFGSPLPAITPPTRTGHTFLGYFSEDGTQYYDNSGNGTRTWDRAQDTTLYAHWAVEQYTVDVDLTLPGGCEATVTINGVPYNGTPLPFDFGTELTVVVTLNNGYKLVSWNGAGISHTARFEWSFTLQNENTVLTGTALPVLETPDFHVDYPNEIFTVAGGIPAGSYRLECGDQSIVFTVDSDGIITFEDGSTASRLHADSYFGMEVKLIVCGDGQANADSDPQTLTVAGRPSAPVFNEDIERINPLDNSIEIIMKNHGSYTYEFACSLLADGSGLNWGSSPLFENLRSGTVYYIYIRVAASENYPHGVEYVTAVTTLSANYLQSQIDRVNALRQPGDGDNVDRLLEETVKKMRALEPSSDYVEQMENIYQDAANRISLARAKDQAIAALRERCEELQNSGAYSEEVGIPALQDFLEQAIASINEAESESEVTRIAEDAELNFRSVLISYLFYGEDFLLSTPGIAWDFRLAASRVVDLAAISAQIQRAVQAGTIVVGGTQMTLAEASEALRSLDVLGYYRLQLTRPDGSSNPTGPFEIRLLIPEDLRGETGLLVAYYANGTQELTVLDTRREGNYLYFTADSVSDFVILGDHAVNLTGAAIALAATLLCQLVAIILLLVRRRKFAKEYRSYGIALPLAALTIRFFPDYAVSLTLVLGALVILFQIVLLVLFLTTDVIHRKKKHAHGEEEPPREQTEGDAPADGSANTAYESADSAGDAAVLTVLTGDIPTEEEAYEELDADAPDRYDSGEEELDHSEYAVYEPDPEPEEASDEEWYGESGFIEPAADPRYSLSDDDGMWDGEDSTGENGEDADAYGESYGEAYDESYDGSEDASYEYDDLSGEEEPEGYQTEDGSYNRDDYDYNEESADDNGETDDSGYHR